MLLWLLKLRSDPMVSNWRSWRVRQFVLNLKGDKCRHPWDRGSNRRDRHPNLFPDQMWLRYYGDGDLLQNQILVNDFVYNCRCCKMRRCDRHKKSKSRGILHVLEYRIHGTKYCSLFSCAPVFVNRWSVCTTSWYRQEVPFFLCLGHGLRKIDWELNHKKYIRISFNTYLECQ